MGKEVLISFGENASESALSILQDECALVEAEVETPVGVRAEPVIQFRVNKGKGSGRQILRLNEARAVLEVLREAHETGYEKVATEAGYVPADEVVRRTINVSEDGTVSWRSTNGKGSKPARVSRDEMPAVLDALEDYVGKALSWAEKHGLTE